MKILVDADACPKQVLQICLKVGRSCGIPVWTIASFNHHISSDNHVVVGNAPQEADLKLINLTDAGDVAVTQDWGLAAMVLGKGARCINPGGWEYQPDKMDFLLEERALKAKLRRGGGRTRGPKKRTLADDLRFANCLIRVLHHEGTS